MHVLNRYSYLFNLGFTSEDKTMLSSTFFSFNNAFIHLLSIHLCEGCEDSKLKIIIKTLFYSCRYGHQSLHYPEHRIMELT